jgi:NADH:ubiquinone oxidoreductase subunit 6 (subunit J)
MSLETLSARGMVALWLGAVLMLVAVVQTGKNRAAAGRRNWLRLLLAVVGLIWLAATVIEYL